MRVKRSEITAVVYSRDFTKVLPLKGVELQVRGYSRSIYGGAKKASIVAVGTESALATLLDCLRCPVIFYDLGAFVVWGGYIENIQLNTPRWSFDADLRNVYNRVQIAYSAAGTYGRNGERGTTAFIANAESVAAYGIKETILSLPDAVDNAHAEAMAYSFLEGSAWPRITYERNDGSQASAKIFCSGWWNTLDWQRYSNGAGYIDYRELDGVRVLKFGDGDIEKYAQGFTLTESWTAYSIDTRLRRINNPTDDVAVDLCADGVDLHPGTVLATATYDGEQLVSMEWYTQALSAPVPLVLDTRYWLVWRRTGAQDPDNYFRAEGNPALGELTGEMEVYTGGNWEAPAEDMDMIFAVGGVQSTTAQMLNILSLMQFIPNAIVAPDSGVLTPQYRDGDATAKACMMTLLRAGTSANKLYTASVDDESRRCTVALEAEPTTVYTLTEEDTLLAPSQAMYPLSKCPVGLWVEYNNALPAFTRAAGLDLETLAYIEEAEFDAVTGTWTPKPRFKAALAALNQVSF